MSAAYQWQWQPVGAVAVNYGLDTEIFDSERFPHAQTFVREAIQNSLDARHDENKPVVVNFNFHEADLGSRRRYIVDLLAKKQTAGLVWPPSWSADHIRWLIVGDSNSRGLSGDLRSRTSDYWNYWLNFGLSNKSGSGRGGRGIGRITFLIASGISSVIGVTRRVEDGATAACGMSLLKPVQEGDDFMSSYAYLAKAPRRSVYDLYDESDFISGLSEAFNVPDYQAQNSTGLSLIIPYPHENLTEDAIVAAAIEHFAPAIILGSLVVHAGEHVVDSGRIDDESIRVASHFPVGALRDDPKRLLALIRKSRGVPHLSIDIEKPGDSLSETLKEGGLEKLRDRFARHDELVLTINVPVLRNKVVHPSKLHAVLSRAPRGQKPIDLFFREGMCLPEVCARNTADVDLVLMSDEGELATYLNFCEGKAHLGLIENKEVKAKLIENGFSGNYAEKRFVRNLPTELRRLVLPDAEKPDASIFSGFFSIPKPKSEAPKKGVPGTEKPDIDLPPPPPPPPPPPRLRMFIVDDLPDGFRVRANAAAAEWPVNMKLDVAYADGSRRPKWSEHDFLFSKLKLSVPPGVAPEVSKNSMIFRRCDSTFELEIRGFDSRRELVTNIRVFRDA